MSKYVGKVFSPDELRDFTDELREQFADEEAKNPDKYSEIDLKRIREDEEYCQRFLKHDEDRAQALKNSKSVLQWRKDFGANDIKFSNIEATLLKLGGSYPLPGLDKDGSENLLITVKLYKMKELDVNELCRIMVYWLELLEARSNGKQMNLVMQAQGAGLANVDMGFLKFMVPCAMYHYPHLFKNIIVYELPWILNAIWKIVKTWMNAKFISKVKFVDANGLKEYLDDSVIPVSMGGKSTYEYSYPHENR